MVLDFTLIRFNFLILNFQRILNIFSFNYQFVSIFLIFTCLISLLYLKGIYLVLDMFNFLLNLLRFMLDVVDLIIKLNLLFNHILPQIFLFLDFIFSSIDVLQYLWLLLFDFLVLEFKLFRFSFYHFIQLLILILLIKRLLLIILKVFFLRLFFFQLPLKIF